MRFEGTSGYVATDDLKVAVNAAITLERPLLVKGEPGTGKTVLALEIAKALNAPLIEWHVKSTTKALQGLYEYDAVSRLRDSQLGDERVKDIRNYIKRGKLWDAFVADERPVLLIDEIDKADIEFPNDLLLELECLLVRLLGELQPDEQPGEHDERDDDERCEQHAERDRDGFQDLHGQPPSARVLGQDFGVAAASPVRSG